MSKSKSTLLLLALFAIIIYGCKKQTETKNLENNDEKSFIISNSVSSDRVNISKAGSIFQFENVNMNGNVMVQGQNATQATTAEPVYPYDLVYNGKIESLLGADGSPLSALDVTTSKSSGGAGNVFAVSYMTGGEAYGGGVDIFKLQNNGTPILTASIKTPNADVTNITNGGGRLYLGMDIENYADLNLTAPAAVGIMSYNVNGNLIKDDIKTVGLKGYSVQDIKYASYTFPLDMLYIATNDNGGLNCLRFNAGENTPFFQSFIAYPGLRSLAISTVKNELIGTTSKQFSKFSPYTGEYSLRYFWDIPSNEVQLGTINAFSNGNLVFGNNFYLQNITSFTGAVIDQFDLGGWIYSTEVVGDMIYIATGNSLIVGQMENYRIKILAKTHFESVFGGAFIINSVKVDGNKVIAACGKRGTYVFTLTEK